MKYTACLFCLLLSGCASLGTDTQGIPERQDENDVSLKKADDCPVAPITWTSKTVGFNQSETLQIISQLEVAVQSDIEQIKTSGNLSASFSSNLNKVLENSSLSKFEVSKSTQDITFALRTVQCAIYNGIFENRRDEAELELLEQLKALRTQRQEIEKTPTESSLLELEGKVRELVASYNSHESYSSSLEEVQKNAARLGNNALLLDDSDLGLGYEIKKYQIAAFAYSMGASIPNVKKKIVGNI